MRLDEITKGEFLDRLKDPALSKINFLFSRLKAALNEMGYNAELYDNEDGTKRIHTYRYEGNTTASHADRKTSYYFEITQTAVDYNMKLKRINITKGVETDWILTWGKS